VGESGKSYLIMWSLFTKGGNEWTMILLHDGAILERSWVITMFVLGNVYRKCDHFGSELSGLARST